MNVNVIKSCLSADVPVILWGPPGTGKTAVVSALAKENGAHLEVLIGSTLDPIDVGGYLLPHPEKGEVVSAPPPWAVRIRAALDRGQEAWLFLDELSCAPASVRAALLRVIHDRAVGDYSLEGCRIIAASNPADTAADGGELDPATANRLAHVDWLPDVASWVRGTLGGWGTNMSKTQAKAAASVAEFIRRHPSNLLAVPKGALAGRAWPSPRSWSALISALALSTPAAHPAIAQAIVGPAGAEWAEFERLSDLPDPEEILSGKKKVPERGDKAHAVVTALVATVLAEHADREKRILKAWHILSALRPDLALGAAQTLLDHTDEIPPEASELAKRIRGVS